MASYLGSMSIECFKRRAKCVVSVHVIELHSQSESTLARGGLSLVVVSGLMAFSVQLLQA